MKKKYVEHFGIKNYFLILGAFLAFLAVCISSFLLLLQKDIDENSRSSLHTNVDRQGYHFKTVIDTNFDHLKGIAASLGEQEDIFCTENMSLIENVAEEQSLDLLAIFDKDGIARYSNGVKKNAADRDYFKKAMEGNNVLSDPLESMVDGVTKVILAVPIYRDGTIVGVLGGSYNVGALNQMLFDDIYDGTGFAMIVSKSGEIVSCDSGEAYRKITLDDNVFEFYVEEGYVSEEAMETVKKNFNSQSAGTLTLESEEGDRYFAYDALNINGWMLCYVVPKDKAQESFKFINQRESMLFAIIIAVMVMLLYLMWQKSSVRQKELWDKAHTDGLTRLTNKIGTEELIGEWISKRRNGERAALIMMDIDYFKKINDTYGHAMGDTVLYKVGHLLKSSFREDDIIGRVGGDEFVVFMKNISSDEFVVQRMKLIRQYFHELLVEGMEGYAFTSSMGAAFLPEDGMSFMDLYKCADAALYETKRRGRNGYTIYKKEMSGEG